LGAEGLTAQDGDVCALADSPQEFAEKILDLFSDTAKANELARRAREHVVATRDMKVLTRKLLASYRTALQAKAIKPQMNADKRG